MREKASLQPHAGTFIVGFSLTNDPSWARYIPLRHKNAENLPEDEVWPIVRPVLERPLAVAHGSKFECRMCRTVGVEVGILSDPMLQGYVLSRLRSFGLKDMVKSLFGHQMVELHELFGWNKKTKEVVPWNEDPDVVRITKGMKAGKQIRFDDLPLTQPVVDYACEDSAWALEEHRLLQPQLDAEPALKRIYEQIELPTSEMMADVEDWGAAVDWESMEDSYARGVRFRERIIAEVKAEFGALLGQDLSGLNLNSPHQLRKILFEKPPAGLGLEVRKLTDGGKKKDNPQPSTDDVALNSHAKRIPAVKRLLEYREVKNLVERHEKWLGLDESKPIVRAPDERVHAHYMQHVVGSGRFSAGDPAIQQLPKGWFWAIGDAGRTYVEAKERLKKAEAQAAAMEAAVEPGEFWTGNFRSFIVASPGTYLLGFDYSQLELRVVAGLAKEPALLRAFEEGTDALKVIASTLLGVPYDRVTPDQRDVAKTLAYALIYRMGEKSLAERLAITEDRSKELFAAFHAGFPAVAAWEHRVIAEGRERGYTLSWLGRRYTVWELNDPNRKIRSKAERVLVNTPVQGGGADIVKIAMLRCQKALRDRAWWGSKVRLIINLHDELQFEVVEELEPGEMVRFLRPCVEFPVPGLPPMKTEWSYGHTWGSGTKITEETRVPAPDTAPVAPEPVQAPAEAPVASNGHREVSDVAEDDLRVIVELSAMPHGYEFRRLLDYIRRVPGSAEVVFKTPDGEWRSGVRSGIGPADSARLSLVAPARVLVPEEQVDADAVVQGVAL